ncbi:MAG: signal peptidase II [Solirubrobacterales bacterium]|nr:signal peptidase II [Solirubrobacterales bacterium]
MRPSDALRLTLVVCGIVVALDQASKALIGTELARGETLHVVPGLALTNTRNDGVAFGLAGGVSPILIAVTIAALGLVLAYLFTHASRPLIWIPAGLLIGGAIGNLADRVRQGSVTDFIDLPLWPTFNLADVAITAGVLALLLLPERRPP